MILDTGPLVAASNRDDPDHRRCVELFESHGQFVVPVLVIAEAGFLIGRAGGPHVESVFLQSMSAFKFEVIAPDPLVLRRAAELVATYGDLPLGTTDAVVMAVAESRHEPRIATLDVRHFTIVRPSGFPHFELYPQH